MSLLEIVAIVLSVVVLILTVPRLLPPGKPDWKAEFPESDAPHTTILIDGPSRDGSVSAPDRQGTRYANTARPTLSTSLDATSEELGETTTSTSTEQVDETIRFWISRFGHVYPLSSSREGSGNQPELGGNGTMRCDAK